MNKKVGIVFYEGWIGVSPTLMSLISYHIQQKDFVKLFIRDDKEFDLSVLDTFDKDKFQAVKIPTKQDFFLLTVLYKIADKIHSYNFFDKPLLHFKKNLTIHQRLKRMISFSKGLHSEEDSFDYFIAIDSTGLFSLKYQKVKFKKFIYLSLELFKLNTDSDWLDKKISSNEGNFLDKKVDLILIQNVQRWNFLKEYHYLQEKKISFLPNSCFDDADDKNIKGTFFHDNLNLDPETIVVASAGMIHPSCLSLEIAEVAGNFKFEKPVKIIFHDRMAGIKNEYINLIIKEGKETVLISHFPVPYSQLGKVFSSIHIGLAIYAPSDDPNFHLIGAASGKLFQYMKYGVPIIANRLPGLSDIIEDNNIGIVIDTLDELENAINKIVANYKWFSENARSVFQEKYQMGLFLSEYYKTLTDLSAN